MTLKQEVREALKKQQEYALATGQINYVGLDQATEAILAAVLARLPEEWQPQLEAADGVAPDGWCSTCDMLLGSDGECGCRIANTMLADVKSVLEGR